MVNTWLQIGMFRKRRMDKLSIHFIIYTKTFEPHKISVKLNLKKM